MAQSRLVVVANRTPPPRSRDAPAPPGGLVAALEPALRTRGGLWLGWSGATARADAPPRLRREGTVEVVTLDLSPAEVRDYYEGFSNQAIWPAMHGFPDRVRLEPDEFKVYCAVNARFAATLLPLLMPDDLVWVHDYHLIPLGSLLRGAGWRGRTGYFHHIPIPPPAAWARIPHAPELAAAFAAYDCIGVQTPDFAERLRATLDGEMAERVRAYPIGIDPARWRAFLRAAPATAFPDLPPGQHVLFGIDRLDYSKGIPLRLAAFERFLREHPEWRERVTLVQWVGPSREGIAAYRAERESVERRAAAINEAAASGPPPVRLVYETRPPEAVAAAYRDCDACLVTSLADGMNLVAKEFVAAQPDDDPGVLVLSRGCGAAHELGQALLVDAGAEGALARAIHTALEMPAEERHERHQALRAAVDANTVHHWRERFLADLATA